MAPIARVKWRPEHDTQVASSSLSFDHSIHVWETSRPHVPKLTFSENTSDTTGILISEIRAVMDQCRYDRLMFKGRHI